LKVVLDHRLFQSEDAACIRDLTELLLATARSPHQLLVDGGQQGQQDWGLWLADHHGALQRSFADVLARGRSPRFLSKPPAITLRVSDEVDEGIDEQGRTASAHSSRAKKLVDTPLMLWLENDDNDSAFLRTVAPAGAFRDWLEHAKAKDWITFRHGGGSDLKNKLEALDPWERLRSWAMCDADTWEPDKRSSSVARLEATCEGQPTRGPKLCRPTVPLRVLRRRAIENYLPMRALKHWANLRHDNNHEQRQRQHSFAHSVAKLDTHAARFNLRHHYHLENGFRAEPEKIPADYKPFREDPVLYQGIGNPIKKVYRENLDIRMKAGHGLFQDAWFAEDEHMRVEVVEIIESIRSRI
jgi:hypothetical protein